MQTLLSTGHSIFFGQPAYEALNRHLLQTPYSGIFLLVDENTHEFCVQRFLSRVETQCAIEIIEIEPGESMKTLPTCAEVWTILTELGADRKSLVINLGGGVITDLGGFIASTYKRGIDFINVPTSLLGMVDASVGGKNGVDLGHLKNQVGTITSPKMVLIDPEFLHTLPQTELTSGFAEMLKHGLIADKSYWQSLAALESISADTVAPFLFDSVRIKNEIVMQDPTENGIRKALNFGHTLGHAIESHFLHHPEKTALLHGEAVAAGMILESYLSWQNHLLEEEEYLWIRQVIRRDFASVEFTAQDIESILGLLVHDKKNEYGKVLFALLDGIGKISIDQNVPNSLIHSAFANYNS